MNRPDYQLAGLDKWGTLRMRVKTILVLAVLAVLSSSVSALTLTSIQPSSAAQGASVWINNLKGSEFQLTGTTTVELLSGGIVVARASNVTVVTPERITCSFNLSGVSAGTYDVRVTNPGGSSATLSGGFVVNAKPSLSSDWWVQKCYPGYNFAAAYFIDQDRGWVVGGTDVSVEAVVMRTTDGGKSWEDQSAAARAVAAGSNRALKAVYFVDDKYGWAVDENGTILRTINGGTSWTLSRRALSFPVGGTMGVSFVNTLEGWVAASDILLHTTDGGENWEDQTIPAEARGVLAVHFVDRYTGYAAQDVMEEVPRGSGNWQPVGPARIIKTTNGGRTWEVVYTTSGPNALSDVFFIDKKVGWVVGHYGLILQTTDGGETWSSQTLPSEIASLPSEDRPRLNKVSFVSSREGWIAGGGSILYTNDGGSTWTVQKLLPGNLRLSMVDSYTGWASMDGNEIYKYSPIDITPPPTPTLGAAAVGNRVDLTWNAVQDVGGGTLSRYEVYRLGTLATVVEDNFSDNIFDTIKWAKIERGGVTVSESDEKLKISGTAATDDALGLVSSTTPADLSKFIDVQAYVDIEASTVAAKRRVIGGLGLANSDLSSYIALLFVKSSFGYALCYSGSIAGENYLVFSEVGRGTLRLTYGNGTVEFFFNGTSIGTVYNPLSGSQSYALVGYSDAAGSIVNVEVDNFIAKERSLTRLTSTTSTIYTDSGLPDGTYDYSVIAVDNYGNRSAFSNIASVTVDVLPPRVISVDSPIGDDVPLTPLISIKFSEEMDWLTVRQALSFIPAIEIGDTSWEKIKEDGEERWIIHFTPASILKKGTLYTGIITSAAKDKTGNQVPSEYLFSFRTISETAADETSPIVVRVAPTNEATGVALRPTIFVQFNEAMNTTSVENAFSLDNVTGTSAWSGNTYIFVPGPGQLARNTSYTATIIGGNVAQAARDIAGNPLAVDKSWSFTTEEDRTPPDVVSVSGAADNRSVSITFTEGIKEEGLSKIIIKDSQGNVVSGSWNWDPSTNTATFAPLIPDNNNRFYSSEHYTITIGTEVEDLVGNSLTEDLRCAFVTADTVGPSISNVKFDGRPYVKDDVISGTAVITADISDVSGVNYNLITLSFKSDTTEVIITKDNFKAQDVYASEKLSYQISPTLPAGSYTVKIQTQDTKGNELVWEGSVQVYSGEPGLVPGTHPISSPATFSPVKAMAAGEEPMVTIAYNLTVAADIDIYIYSPEGKAVFAKKYAARSQGGRAGYNAVTWNGKDATGNIVGNGIYPFRIVSKGKVIGTGYIVVYD